MMETKGPAFLHLVSPNGEQFHLATHSIRRFWPCAPIERDGNTVPITEILTDHGGALVRGTPNDLLDQIGLGWMRANK